MAGVVRLSAQAEEDYNEIPLTILDEFDWYLQELADHPSRGIDAPVPFRPGSLLFDFVLENEIVGELLFQIRYLRCQDEISSAVSRIILRTG